MKPGLTDHSGRLRPWFVAAMLILLVFFAYSAAVNGPWIWDDSSWLTENPAVQHHDLSWIWRGYRSASQYYPLTVSTYWFEYRLWGFWLPGYRIVNILLHATSAFLLWKLLTRLKIPGATLAAFIWAIHPIQVETVVWITERKNTLSGVFFFTALLTWMEVVNPQATRQRKKWMYLATICLYLAALLSKTSTFFLPVAMIGVAWIQTGKLQARHIARTVPFFVIGFLMGLFTMHSEHLLSFGQDVTSAWNQTPAQRIILAGKCFWFYIWKLLWPAELAQIYPQWGLDPSNPIEYLWTAAALALFIILGIYSWRRRDSKCLIAIFIYLAGIFPVIGFMKYYTQIYTYVADHYNYLPGAALIACFAALLTCGWNRIAQKLAIKPMITAAAATALILVLCVRSLSQSMVYRDFITLWQDTLRINPRAWAAMANIAYYYDVNLNQPLEALPWYDKANAVSPQSSTYFYLGNTYEKLGRIDDAVASYRKAIAIDPTYLIHYQALSRILIARNEHEDNLKLIRQAVDYNPEHIEFWLQIAVYKRLQNRLIEAAHHCHYILDLNPGYTPAIFELGLVYANQNNNPRALKALAAAVEMEPESFEYRRNYAIILKRSGQEEEAQRQMKIALELRAREQQKKQQP